MMRFGYGPMHFGGGYLIMAVIMAAIVVLAILGTIALVRYIRISGQSHRIQVAGVNPAMQILNERYARSEITDEEYKAKKTELGK